MRKILKIKYTNKDALLESRLQETRKLDNAMQHYWKLVLERLYHIIPLLDEYMHFAEGGKMFTKNVELAVHNQQVMMCM